MVVILLEIQEHFRDNYYNNDCHYLFGTRMDDKTCLNCEHRYPREENSLALCELGTLETGTYVAVSAEDKTKEIEACNFECYDCVGETNADCISCKSGFFLQKGGRHTTKGQCLPKISGSITVELAVKRTNANDVADRDGSTVNPFVDLENALRFVSHTFQLFLNFILFRA